MGTCCRPGAKQATKNTYRPGLEPAPCSSLHSQKGESSSMSTSFLTNAIIAVATGFLVVASQAFASSTTAWVVPRGDVGGSAACSGAAQQRGKDGSRATGAVLTSNQRCLVVTRQQRMLRSVIRLTVLARTRPFAPTSCHRTHSTFHRSSHCCHAVRNVAHPDTHTSGYAGLFDGRYWARTSDPQLVDSGQPFASVRWRTLRHHG